MPIKFNCELPYEVLRQKYTDYETIYTDGERLLVRMKFGSADIRVPEEPIFKLMINEVLNPFYLFQIFSCVLWLNDGSEIYSFVIIIYLMCSLIISLWDYHQNNLRVRKMARYSIPIKLLKRDKSQETIDSDQLLPGDIIEVPNDAILPCDLILLTGSAIVNEAMLTGESIPVLKTNLPPSNEIYSDQNSGKHTLYGGTRVI